MIIYLVYFAASAYFAYLARKAEDRKMFFLFSAVSISITAVLAGLRNYDVGTDVMNYLEMSQFWAGANSADSLSAYMSYYMSLGLKEPLFALFVGIIAQLTGDFRVFLLLSHVVIVSAVYIGAFRVKHHARPELILLLFYLLYYNNSLNIIRQYMAMAIVFAFFADIEQREFVRYSIAVLIAALIHNTAVISFVPLAVYLILFPKKEITTAPFKRTLCVCVLILVGVCFFIPVIRFAIECGILSQKYSFYFQDKTSRLVVTRLVLRILEVTGLVVCYKNLKEQNEHLEFYIVNTVAFMAFLEMSRSIVYGQRIPAHFSLVNIVTVVMLEKCHKKASIRMLWAGVIILLAAYYWYHTYVLGGGSETIPYRFGIWQYNIPMSMG